MKKTMEQIVLEGQAEKCGTMEELFVLWQLAQQMEENPGGITCYPEVDQRSFHVDGIVSPGDYTGVLYILKETNMRKYIQTGQTMPSVSDVRREFLAGKSPSGEVEYIRHLEGMQRILNVEASDSSSVSDSMLRRQAALLYLNKRGGKAAADEVSMQYGKYYMSFIKRQIELLSPKTIVCCGEDIFRLVVMEVFQNKRKKKNQEIYMKWKDVVQGDQFFADSQYRPAKDREAAAVRVIRMWNPSYRVNNGQYVSLEEYLKEFGRRVAAEKQIRKES